MKRKLPILLLPAFLMLQGCVVVVGTETDDGVYWGDRDYAVNGIEYDGDALSRKVARAIAEDVDLAGQDIRVSSDDGNVVLKGRVGDVRLLEHALASARGVEGVDHVVSRIVVDGG